MSDETTALGHIHIVLVRPQQSGNIGAAARAIANHGLGQLRLVSPQAFDPEEARWMAPHARHIVDEAGLYSCIADAIADCATVVGTCGKQRTFSIPQRRPETFAHAVVRGSTPTAVLFGPEDVGLSNVDLEPCEATIALPTSPVQPSLNLGQAVTVLGSCLFATHQNSLPDSTPPSSPRPAVHALREAAVEDAVGLLETSGYLRSRSPSQVRATLHQAAAALSHDQDFLAILRGMLKSVRHAIGTPSSSSGGAN